jgi:hypothetical protein
MPWKTPFGGFEINHRHHSCQLLVLRVAMTTVKIRPQSNFSGALQLLQTSSTGGRLTIDERAPISKAHFSFRLISRSHKEICSERIRIFSLSCIIYIPSILLSTNGALGLLSYSNVLRNGLIWDAVVKYTFTTFHLSLSKMVQLSKNVI